jgi:hypothetical protein
VDMGEGAPDGEGGRAREGERIEGEECAKMAGDGRFMGFGGGCRAGRGSRWR